MFMVVRYLQKAGDSLHIHHDDGTIQTAYPTGSGLYLVAYTAPPPDPDPDPDPDPEPGVWSHPAPGAPIYSAYGPRSGGFHYGTDFSSTTAAVGVPILAVTEMLITTAVDAYEGGNETAGTYVKGNNGTYTFSYAHGADNTLAVSAGQTVPKGTILFYEGATGNVTGTHLHFEIYEGVYSDPWAGYPVFPPNPEPILAANGVAL